MTKRPLYIDYHVPHQAIWANINNPTWYGWLAVRYIADWVPGGRLYPTIWGGPENINAKEFIKIWQQYGNADRFEFVLQYVFSNLIWKNKDKGFCPGVGEDDTDFVDEDNHHIDGKLYFDYNSLTNYVLDLFMNKAGYSLADWLKAVNKLFHTPGQLLLAYVDATHTLYAINRPDHILNESEIVNYIHEVPEFIPNVIIKDGAYAIDNTEPFKIIHC